MMAHQTLLLLAHSCVLILSLQQSVAKSSSYCTPSSCGIIPNISYPFRLKHDPKHCGDSKFELACEDNVTLFYRNSYKLYVKAINYSASTIRLVDASININDTCSFPTYSSAYPYYLLYDPHQYYSPPYVSSIVKLMSCPHPLENSSLYTNITQYCQTSNSSNSRYSYIIVGRIKASDVNKTCRVEAMVGTSWKFKDLNNASLEEIHSSLLYGFKVEFCPDCYRLWTLWDKFKSFILGARGLFLISVAILVFISAGVSLPLMIIVGFTCGLILLFIPLDGIYDNIGFSLFGDAWLYKDVKKTFFINGTLSGVIFIIMICIPRFFICPLIAWLLICKFRRRHLSMYEAIESFLQSNNNLMPIRYKYSDIHKMTKGFQDKLGEGGYGSVYKGKLRSSIM